MNGDEKEIIMIMSKESLQRLGIELPDPEQVVEKRLSHGLTTQECANMVLKSLSTWANYESGRRPMDPTVWKLFCILTKGVNRKDVVRNGRKTRPFAERRVKEVSNV